MADSMFPSDCRCPERYSAMEREGFQYLADRDGWCFADGPRRTMTFKAAYLLGERGGENHTGEPMVYVCCPFCGRDLPLPTLPREPWRSNQSDGEDGG